MAMGLLGSHAAPMGPQLGTWRFRCSFESPFSECLAQLFMYIKVLLWFISLFRYRNVSGKHVLNGAVQAVVGPLACCVWCGLTPPLCVWCPRCTSYGFVCQHQTSGPAVVMSLDKFDSSGAPCITKGSVDSGMYGPHVGHARADIATPHCWALSIPVSLPSPVWEHPSGSNGQPAALCGPGVVITTTPWSMVSQGPPLGLG